MTKFSGRHFTKIYADLARKGEVISGETATKELRNYSFEVLPYQYMTSFTARRFNLRYCLAEWAWYLRGDRFDTSIEQYATLWKKIKTADGGFNSNYGQYIFGERQFDWVVDSLVRDPNSRQASIQLLSRDHMYAGNPDVVCTHGINFQIRNGRLDMTVMMRSNDAIFGLTNDVFCFGQLLLMVHSALTRERYSGLKVGTYTHFACSLHVYERHWDMLDSLVELAGSDYEHFNQPRPHRIEDFWAIRDGNRGQSEYADWVLSHEI